MNMHWRQSGGEKGSVSLFIVIFAALLIITIVTAFIRIMIQDQLQATANDLSKSAYDSAQVGVEDVKRGIVEYYQRGCATLNETTAAEVDKTRCQSLENLFVEPDASNGGWTSGCDATERAGLATRTQGEVKVESGEHDEKLDQAYTCIKVQMNPLDVKGKVGSGRSQYFKLDATGTDDIASIVFEWHIPDTALDVAALGADYQLEDTWKPGRPPVIRLQLLQYGGNFQATSFDKIGADNENNFTLFLLPTSIPGLNTASFTDDNRQTSTSGVARPTTCDADIGKYVCKTTIAMPPVASGDRKAYLRISKFYTTNDTDFQVTMLNAAGVKMNFDSVQAAVDATGRANDHFRRIESRITIGGGTNPNAESAVDVTKSLCKIFAVTKDRAIQTQPRTGTPVCPNLP